MRKVISVLTLFFITTGIALAKSSDDREIIVKLGFQPQTTINLDGKSENMKIGLSAGAEFFQYFGNIFALGAGTTIDFARELKKKDIKGNLACMPLYVGAKARTPLHGFDDTYAFLSGRVGYSIPMAKDLLNSATGGLYWALGFGINIDFFVIEAVYAKHNFSYEINNNDKNADYSTITLYAGLKFE